MIVLDGIRREASVLAFGHDGRDLFVGGGWHPLEVWDSFAGTRREVRAPLSGRAEPLAVGPAGWLYSVTGYGTLVATGPDGRACADTELLPDAFRHGTNAVVVRPDGARLVVAAEPPQTLLGFAQPPSGKPQLLWSRPIEPEAAARVYRVRSVAYFPDGDDFVVLEVNYANSSSRFTIRAGTTGEVRVWVNVPAAWPDQLRVAPDSASVVVRCGRVLNVYSPADWTARPRRVLNTTSRHFTAVAYHPSGRHLAATSNDQSVKLYDTETWEVVKAYTWNVSRLRSVAFAPDGSRAAVGGDRGKVVVFDIDV